MTTSELHRQFYLQAAGIRLWYAKKPLPGAAPSPDFWFPEEEKAPPVSADEFPIASPEARSRASTKPSRPEGRRSVDLKALMADQSTEARSEKAAASGASTVSSPEDSNSTMPGERAVAPSEQQPESEPRRMRSVQLMSANLALWQSETYLLVSQWSDEASAGLQESLANSVLKALGEEVIGERQSFQWPVFRNAQVPGNSSDDMSQAIARCVSAYQGKSVISLGAFSDQPSAQRAKWLSLSPETPSVDFPHSLAELASAPAYKRELWESLKAGLLS